MPFSAIVIALLSITNACWSWSFTVTPIVTAISPALDSVTFAVSLIVSVSATPVTVTVCGVAKLAVVNVSVAGATPAVIASEVPTATVTSAAG